MSLYDQFLSEKVGTTTMQSGGLYQQYLNEQTPKPSLFQNILSGIKNYVVGSYQQAKDFIANPPTPKETLGNLVEPAKQAFNQGTQAVGDFISNVEQGKGGMATDVADMAKLAGSVAGLVLSPVSGTFNLAEKTPGLKQVADAINVPFTLTGMAGAYTSGKIVDFLPISQQSKDILKAPIQELGSLAGQIVLGGKIMGKAGDFLKTNKEITPENAHTIVDQAKTEIPQEHLATKQTSLFDQFKTETKPVEVKITPESQPLLQEAQKYKSAEEFRSAYSVKKSLEENGVPINKDGTVTLYHSTLPERANAILKSGEIRGGSTASGGMTGLQLDKSAFFGVDKKWTQETWGSSGSNKLIEIKVPYEDIRQPAQNKLEVYFEGGLKRGEDGIWRPIQKPRDTFYNSLPARDYDFMNPKSQLTDIWNKAKAGGKIETKTVRVSKAASDINQEIVKQGFDAMSPQALSVYDPITKADQIQKVSDFMTKDIQNATDASIGKSPIPNDIHPQVLFNAIEAKATKEGDINLMRELAKSPIATQLSEAGQTLGAHGFNDNPNSPVRIIQDIQIAREANIEKRVGLKKAKDTTVKTIKDTIAKTTSRPTWEQFISDIKCNS